MSLGLIIGLMVMAGIFFVLGPMGVLAVYGVRKYIANAKLAEARNVLHQVQRLAVSAYERDHRLCPSATRAVPSSADSIRGKKYMATANEWNQDAGREAGFACLGFLMDTPQYFQYTYEADATSFTAIAHGDLNGDGALSTFKAFGQVVGDEVRVSPSLLEDQPDE